jgi:branched-chain amino acid transport system substrate-binding protein
MRVRLSCLVTGGALALAVFTCVPSVGSSGAGAATSSGTPLVIGVLTTETTSEGTNLDPQNTMNAWEHYINGNGGIGGHKVQVVLKDDHNDPAQAEADAQALIQDHVIAIIDDSTNDNTWASAVASARIPVLCGIADGDGFTCQSNANFFPSGTTVLPGLYGSVYSAKYAGAKSMAVVYCTEVPACAQAVPVFKGFSQKLGMTASPALAASETAISYTAQCVELHSEGAQAVEGAGPPSNKLAADCAQQGYHPVYIQAMGTWENVYLTDQSLNGTTGVTSDIPWFLNAPATKTFLHVMGSYLHKTGSSSNTVLPYTVSTTWAAAQLFADAAAHVGATPTAQDIYNGLYALHGTTLDGFSPPLNFVKGQPTTVSCFYLVAIKNGHYVAPQGAHYDCEPAS